MMVLVGEQADSPLTPLSAPEQLPCCKDSRGKSFTFEVDHGGERRQRRRGQTSPDLRLLLDTESDPSDSRKKAASVRQKPVEPLSPMLSLYDFDTKLDRKKSQPNQLSKTNAQYHKLFKEVSKDEILRQSYTCAWQKEMLYQGKMFVSDNWICFHSKVFGKDIKISIPVMSVKLIKKTKTALLVPNALVIVTTTEQHVFVSFLSRNNTFKLLKSICPHLEVDKISSSPVTSSCENSFRTSCPSSLPLDLSGDFSDLDGVVQQRRQNMMESSSSGSQTPDSDKIDDFSNLPDTFLNAVKSREVSVHADIHLQNPSQKHGSTLKNEAKSQFVVAHFCVAHTWQKVKDYRNSINLEAEEFGMQTGSGKTAHGLTLKETSSQPKSLHVLLFIYLFLVGVLILSSCYMALKIVALEHRLNSLLSMGELIHNENTGSQRSQVEVNAEIYGELSTNLFKLDKIQRNLRKLLEET